MGVAPLVEDELHPVGVEVTSALGRDGFLKAGFGHGEPKHNDLVVGPPASQRLARTTATLVYARSASPTFAGSLPLAASLRAPSALAVSSR
jgi:hypothetical protein